MSAYTILHWMALIYESFHRSEDGLLAIAALGNVHVMVSKSLISFVPGSHADCLEIPRRSRLKDDSDTREWVRVTFKVNHFTAEEWPLFGPRPSSVMSIGEEQSDSNATAIAWSTPGLARHGRPVLAVLTSNGLLSLWASTTDPRESDSWERVLVINKSNKAPARNPKLAFPRIRSMAWSWPLKPIKDDHNHHQSSWVTHILAIGLDDGSLHVLKITSPVNTESDHWRCERLCGVDDIHKGTFEINQTLRNKENGGLSSFKHNKPSLFRMAMEASHFIDSLHFESWTQRDAKTFDTVVSFRTTTDVGFLSLSCEASLLNQYDFELKESECLLPVLSHPSMTIKYPTFGQEQCEE